MPLTVRMMGILGAVALLAGCASSVLAPVVHGGRGGGHAVPAQGATATGTGALQGGGVDVDNAATTAPVIEEGHVEIPPLLQGIVVTAGEPTVPYTVVQHLEATIDPAKLGRAPTRADGDLLLRALAMRAHADGVIEATMDGSPTVQGGLRVRGRAVRFLGKGISNQ